MVLQGDWVDRAADVRAQLKPPVYAVVDRLMREGWRLRAQGHKFMLYCPCGPGGHWIRVNGTPRDPDTHARRIDRLSAHCPDRHEMMK